MFDLHSHILPDIDDGARDLATALKMLKMAAQSGTTVIAATPHVIEGRWRPTWDKIVTGCDQISDAARREGIDIRIVPGAEVALQLDILESISGPGAYCLNNGRYMLVELPALEIPGFTAEFFFTLQARGITPIVAHPERHPEIARRPELLLDWLDKGIMFQVNGSSLTGKMGERTMKTAELLVANNMVQVIGSDAHTARTRNPNLSPALERIAALRDAQLVEELLVNNPAKVMRSEEIEVAAAASIDYPRKTNKLKHWLTKLWA